ncbi:hypothetical protein ElyMa_002304100 [Elysia marginata]|uniref:Uncharacterized protein n=1 Tax=Elysia marginata TaxID=1093978 RepID=A0AAV4G2V4_9GAST|nr:hypothetical protein ElyMa_002304100 [Elysia marginata]
MADHLMKVILSQRISDAREMPECNQSETRETTSASSPANAGSSLVQSLYLDNPAGKDRGKDDEKPRSPNRSLQNAAEKSSKKST